MSRKATTLVLAVFHLLQATWLLHAGVDLLLPPLRQAAAAVSGSCCSSDCGCPEDAKKTNGCCCAKQAQAFAARKKSAAPSAIEAARCKGVDEAMRQAFTQPVVCGFAGIGAETPASSEVLIPESKPVHSPVSLALEK